MAPSLLYIVWHSEVLAADVYRSPSGILKLKKKIISISRAAGLCDGDRSV